MSRKLYISLYIYNYIKKWVGWLAYLFLQASNGWYLSNDRNLDYNNGKSTKIVITDPARIKAHFFQLIILQHIHPFIHIEKMSPGSLIMKKQTQKENKKSKKPTKKPCKIIQSDSLDEEDLYTAPVRKCNNEEEDEDDEDNEKKIKIKNLKIKTRMTVKMMRIMMKKKKITHKKTKTMKPILQQVWFQKRNNGLKEERLGDTK